ncbi:hypothetical protein A2482_00055 [Candidatus Falkowbacteria bacterium RIFOXYC2_FULL_48_21]|uniref:Glycosyltransferase subfamily 4-like N-terminal domain-containing protein n=1 Tax=Candidatus Falkowbacteria bacterium RIFOXYC2_FULL_48_21 TaxID=1798005 RepID=A0A1F5T9N4_9BACT|nr:MAG: hypothetical protein A2482_00055 [Candidatus Falkowbacteria bacterium RIFOXYC2_FULL_48_21]
MITITHIIGRLCYGGAEKLLLDICRKIDKERFSVEVLVLQDDNQLANQFEEAEIKVTYFHKRGKFDFNLVKRVAQHLTRTKPDIVHTHLFAADFYGERAARLAGVKRLISTKHDILSEGFWRDYFGRRARRAFDRVIAISKATKEFLIEREGLFYKKVDVIYNGIDMQRFFDASVNILPRDGIVIGSVGRLSKEKGHKHLIRACRFLKNQDWRLILVGDGPMKRELMGLTEYLGLENQVKFVGAVDDVRPYLKEMDVFVLPSVSEGLSLVILEAAAAGKIVVATNVGGVPEIIHDKEDGLLFRPKNIEQLVAHLNWIDDHRDAAVKMAKRLQASVMEKFDINKTIEQYESLYERIV